MSASEENAAKTTEQTIVDSPSATTAEERENLSINETAAADRGTTGKGRRGERIKQKTGEVMHRAKAAQTAYQEKMAQYPPERQRQKKVISLSHVMMILIGNFVVAFGFQGFVSANNFFSGGAYGLAGILNHYLPAISFSMAVFLFSVPMLIVGWLNVDKKFVALTAFSIIFQVFILRLFDGVVIYRNDTLLAAIFGGVMMGLGDGLVLRGGSGTNGIHLVAMTLKKRLGLSVSTITMSLNLIIVCCSAAIFGLERGLYTLILIFVASRVISMVIDGMSRKRTAFIVTAHGEEIGDQLMDFLNRGVTMMPGIGLYSGHQTDVLFCVVNVLEVAKLKNIVRDIDPHAFITVYETAEVAGHFSKNSLLFDKRSDE